MKNVTVAFLSEFSVVCLFDHLFQINSKKFQWGRVSMYSFMLKIKKEEKVARLI